MATLRNALRCIYICITLIALCGFQASAEMGRKRNYKVRTEFVMKNVKSDGIEKVKVTCRNCGKQWESVQVNVSRMSTHLAKCAQYLERASESDEAETRSDDIASAKDSDVEIIHTPT